MKSIFGEQKSQPYTYLEGVALPFCSPSYTYMYLFYSNFREIRDTLVMCTHKIPRIVMLFFYVINTIYTLLGKNQRKNSGVFSGPEIKVKQIHICIWGTGVSA